MRNGWDPTYAADDPESNKVDGGKVTDRLNVLLDAWKNNERF